MTKSKRSTIILSILLIISLSSAVYFYNQNKQLKNGSPAQAQAQANITKALVDKVSKLILLPDEAPTIAPITDPKLLKDQPFFAGTKAGDQVLFFPVAHKVIIYDPAANKIVDVGFFNVSKNTDTQPTETEDKSTESTATSSKKS